VSTLEIGALSIIAIVVLVYLGVYVAVALGVVSFVGVWYLRGDFMTAQSLLIASAEESIANYVLGVVPLFVLMGLLVSASDIAKDSYEVCNRLFGKIRGGLAIATVAANTVFAAVTGVSIASAAVFTRVSVPEMLRFGYHPRFAVGVVAGSSVLGMLIPPSVLLIIYAILTEQSVGTMFIAGIVPGLVLAGLYCLLILGLARFVPRMVYRDGKSGVDPGAEQPVTITRAVVKVFPVTFLIALVIGGIYGGVFTATEAGAAGSAATLVIALYRRKLGLAALWKVMMETGNTTATILILVVGATLYSRMLGISGLPTRLGNWVSEVNLSLPMILFVFLVVVLLLGTIIDSISIILITVPLFLPLLKPFGVNLVWFGIITVVAVEIGLLTPPFGISVFVVKSSLEDRSITLKDIFVGTAPFAVTMFVVMLLIIAFPVLSTILIR